MIRRLAMILCCLTAAASPALAAAQYHPYPRYRAGPPPTGPTFGAWVGLGGTSGMLSNEGDGRLGDVISHDLAFGLGAGYRVSPFLRFGAFLEAAPLFMAGNACAPGDRCGGTDVRFGVDAQLHLAPRGRTDPWIGVGLGYEWLGFDATACDSTGTCFPEHWRFSGWVFPRLSVGLDVAVSPTATLGPYLAYTAGQYSDVETRTAGSQSIQDQAFHGWLEIGIRGNLNP